MKVTAIYSTEFISNLIDCWATSSYSSKSTLRQFLCRLGTIFLGSTEYFQERTASYGLFVPCQVAITLMDIPSGAIPTTCMLVAHTPVGGNTTIHWNSPTTIGLNSTENNEPYYAMEPGWQSMPSEIRNGIAELALVRGKTCILVKICPWGRSLPPNSSPSDTHALEHLQKTVDVTFALFVNISLTFRVIHTIFE